MLLLINKSLFFLWLKIAKKFHCSNLSSNFSSIYLENFVNFLRGVKAKFYFDRSGNSFYIIENNKKIAFNDKIRGIDLYRDGISKRAEFIFFSYCLDKVSFSKNDIIIDCGANYGDLYLKLSNLIEPENYIGIEPSPSDFETLKLNTDKKCRIINKGLGNTNGTLPFYISLSEADSSFIKPNHFTKTINIPVIRLDKLIEELNLNRIKLLKVEAEGYEPEVLEGLADKIEICEYIAIDGGYERGVKNEQTFTAVTNYLLDNNFKMIDIYLPWCRALFINKKNFQK
jgi:FkbM family methyltransferase